MYCTGAISSCKYSMQVCAGVHDAYNVTDLETVHMWVMCRSVYTSDRSLWVTYKCELQAERLDLCQNLYGAITSLLFHTIK